MAIIFMAEIKTFLTSVDFFDVSEFIIKNFSASLIPTINHDEAKEIKLSSTTDIKEHLKKFKKRKSTALSYFIVSPHWSVEPIYFKKIESTTGLGIFYSAQSRYGGPYIEWIPNFGFPNTTEGKIICGLISDYPYYISGSFLSDKDHGYQTIDRPMSIVAAMKEIKIFIKKNGGQVINRNQTTRLAYAMRGALAQLDNGLKLAEGDITYAKK